MIIGQLVLQEIKQVIPNAVIAGGYVRDTVNDIQFKDIDVFFPLSHKKALSPTRRKHHPIQVLAKKLVKENSNFVSNNNFHLDWQDYDGLIPFLGKLDLTYRGTIPVQIIGYDLPEENFAEKLIETFSFNIDKCYYDGLDTIVSKKAQQDMDWNTLTLCSLPGGIDELPRAMKKYFRLLEKYPNYGFNSPILEVKNIDTVVVNDKESKTSKKWAWEPEIIDVPWAAVEAIL